MRGSDRDDKSKLGKPIPAAHMSEICAVQDTNSRRLERLFQSLLHGAFRGEL